MLRIASAVATNPGLRRESNEDAYCSAEDLGLFMVADGMGGHVAGEIASRMAIDTIKAFVGDTHDADPNRTWPFPYDPSLTLAGNRLKGGFRLANRRLGAAMAENEALRGMATTVAAILFGPADPVVAHVGDSRVYRLRGGTLTQITEDHSWVGEQVRAGLLTEGDARVHPWRNVVTRALSGNDDPEVEVAPLEIEHEDGFLICSDGLSGVVSHAKLETILTADRSLDETCAALIDAANDAGGPDNITVALLRVDVA